MVSAVALGGLGVAFPAIAGLVLIQMGVGLLAGQFASELFRKDTAYVVRGADGKEYLLSAEQYVLLCNMMLKKSE